MQLSDVKQWIEQRKPQIETALKTLVEINTHTVNRRGVDKGMDMLANITQDIGFPVETINGRHRLIKAKKGQGKPRILLISHMDTVFPPEENFLHYEDLGDGFVNGPGVGDIKGGLVMGLWAMQAICELCSDYDVQMVISADEENGSPTIRDWYLAGNVNADYAIGLEPGFPQGELTPTVPLGVVYHRRGYGAIRFVVHGKASHSGTPQLGLSAIEAMAQRITRLHQLSDPSRNISVNVGLVQGGISPNTVAGTAQATVSFRYETQAHGEETRAAIESIIQGTYVHNEEINLSDSVEMQVEAFIPPMESSDQSQAIVDIVLEEATRLGHNVVPIRRGGGSDANYISAGGTSSICGMGAPAQGIHTTSEKIYLPMLFERIELLTATIYRLINDNPGA